MSQPYSGEHQTVEEVVAAVTHRMASILMELYHLDATETKVRQQLNGELTALRQVHYWITDWDLFDVNAAVAEIVEQQLARKEKQKLQDEAWNIVRSV